MIIEAIQCLDNAPDHLQAAAVTCKGLHSKHCMKAVFTSRQHLAPSYTFIYSPAFDLPSQALIGLRVFEQPMEAPYKCDVLALDNLLRPIHSRSPCGCPCERYFL